MSPEDTYYQKVLRSLRENTQKTHSVRLLIIISRALGSRGPTCRHLQVSSGPVSKYFQRKLLDTTFLARLVYAKSLQIADTRAFILGIRRVLLGLPQHLGEGQLHVLVYCFQQEVSEQQKKNTGHSEDTIATVM